METKQVGPYTIKTLNVGEGLDIVHLAADGNQAGFQKALILASTSRDGKPVSEEAFKDMMPYLGEVIGAAMDLNGFRKSENE